MARLFVYGSLLTGAYNHHVAAPYIRSVELGRVKGWLYDKGSYPALVVDEKGPMTAGEWLTVTEEALGILDEFEDYYGPGHPFNEYERVWVQDAESDADGWVYSCVDAKGLKLIPGGSWRDYADPLTGKAKG